MTNPPDTSGGGEEAPFHLCVNRMPALAIGQLRTLDVSSKIVGNPVITSTSPLMHCPIALLNSSWLREESFNVHRRAHFSVAPIERSSKHSGPAECPVNHPGPMWGDGFVHVAVNRPTTAFVWAAAL